MKKDNQPVAQSYVFDNVAPTRFEREVVAPKNGFVDDFNPDITGYPAHASELYVLDQQLDTHIKTLTSDLEVLHKQLEDKKELLQTQGATQDDVTQVERSIFEKEQELAQANQQKEVGKVTSPYDFTLRYAKVHNGDQVVKGQALLEGYDSDTVGINLTLPPNVNDFSRMIFKINEQPVIVENVNWSLDPMNENAQVSFVAHSSSPYLWAMSMLNWTYYLTLWVFSLLARSMGLKLYLR